MIFSKRLCLVARIILVLMIFTTSCASGRKNVVFDASANPPQTEPIVFNPKLQYEFIVRDRDNPVISRGDRIAFENTAFVFKNSSGIATRSVSADAIQVIHEIPAAKGRGKRALIGGGIGAGVGLVVGVVLAAAIQSGASCHPDAEMECGVVAQLLWGIGLPALTLISGGAGAGIGALTTSGKK